MYPLIATRHLLLIGFVFFTIKCTGQTLERYRTIKDTSYMSKNLGYKKHLQITVPIEYQDGLSQSFPLIIVFDMQNQRNYQYILHNIDYLTANEQIHQL